jgi:hypothetical protein
MSAKNKFGLVFAIIVTLAGCALVCVVCQMEETGTIPVEQHEFYRIIAGYSGTCAGASGAPLLLWLAMYALNVHPSTDWSEGEND